MDYYAKQMENNDKKIPMLKQLLEDIVGNLSEEKIVDSFLWKLLIR